MPIQANKRRASGPRREASGPSPPRGRERFVSAGCARFLQLEYYARREVRRILFLRRTSRSDLSCRSGDAITRVEAEAESVKQPVPTSFSQNAMPNRNGELTPIWYSCPAVATARRATSIPISMLGIAEAPAKYEYEVERVRQPGWRRGRRTTGMVPEPVVNGAASGGRQRRPRRWAAPPASQLRFLVLYERKRRQAKSKRS